MAAGTSKRFDGDGLRAPHGALLRRRRSPRRRDRGGEVRVPPRASASRRRTLAHGAIDDVLALYDALRARSRGRARLRDRRPRRLRQLAPRARRCSARSTTARAARSRSSSRRPPRSRTVLDIRWDTGPSGRVTPVAIVAPVELAGATVQRASLHNAANVRALGIGVGDEVLVSRRNDVIPYVEEVVEKHGPAAAPPDDVRRSATRRSSVEGEYLVCRNTAVPRDRRGPHPELGRRDRRARVGRQAHRAARRGEARAGAGATSTSSTWEDIAALDRRGEKSAKKCLAELARPAAAHAPRLHRRARHGQLRAGDGAAPRRGRLRHDRQDARRDGGGARRRSRGSGRSRRRAS